MPTFTLDDREIEFEPGETVIAAARRAGVTIPHYCWHPGLSVAGNCRMCLVEVEGFPKLQIACNTGAREGMVVKMGSEWAHDARSAVMEFLLINHPLDCPICDQAGECKLQDYAVAHGDGYSRFEEHKVEKRKRVPFSDKVMYDGERCILCTRCVRFCDEIGGVDELTVVNRGDENEIALAPGRELTNAYSMNIIDICPVGALTSRDFRFASRVWFMDFVRSVCPSCARGCNVTIGAREGEILRMVPAENPHVNEWWMCDHGRLNYGFVAENRAAAPLVAGRPAEWEPSLEAAADLLEAAKQAGGEKTFGLASAWLTNEELFLFRRVMRDVVGASSLDVVRHVGDADETLIRSEKSPNDRGATAIGVDGSGPIALDGLAAAIASGRITTLVAWGEDPTAIEELAPVLDRLERLLVVSAWEGGATGSAHVALVGATPFEKDGTVTSFEGRVQRVRPAIPPVGGARPDWRILTDLLALLGDHATILTPRAAYAMLAAEVPAFHGTSWDAIGDLGVLLPAASPVA